MLPSLDQNDRLTASAEAMPSLALPADITALVRDKLVTVERGFVDVAAFAATCRAHHVLAWARPCPTSYAEGMSTRAEAARRRAANWCQGRGLERRRGDGTYERLQLPDLAWAATEMTAQGGDSYLRAIVAYHSKLRAMEAAAEVCEAHDELMRTRPADPSLRGDRAPSLKARHPFAVASLLMGAGVGQFLGLYSASGTFLGFLLGRPAHWAERAVAAYLLSIVFAWLLFQSRTCYRHRRTARDQAAFSAASDAQAKFSRRIDAVRREMREKVLALAAATGEEPVPDEPAEPAVFG